eukprot:1369623-Amorphochlora_amoeboformis.AAC.1
MRCLFSQIPQRRRTNVLKSGAVALVLATTCVFLAFGDLNTRLGASLARTTSATQPLSLRLSKFSFRIRFRIGVRSRDKRLGLAGRVGYRGNVCIGFLGSFSLGATSHLVHVCRFVGVYHRKTRIVRLIRRRDPKTDVGNSQVIKEYVKDGIGSESVAAWRNDINEMLFRCDIPILNTTLHA